jgi:hypothetical protein
VKMFRIAFACAELVCGILFQGVWFVLCFILLRLTPFISFT